MLNWLITVDTSRNSLGWPTHTKDGSAKTLKQDRKTQKKEKKFMAINNLDQTPLMESIKFLISIFLASILINLGHMMQLKL